MSVDNGMPCFHMVVRIQKCIFIKNITDILLILLFQYLDKIGQLWFGLPPPQNTQHGFFGKLYILLLLIFM